MCFLTLITIVLLTIGVYACTEKNEVKFDVEPSLANKICPPSGRVFEATEWSLVSCLRVAAENEDCQGVSYHKDSKTCIGCDAPDDTLGQFLTFSGTAFYVRHQDLPDGFVDVSGYQIYVVKDNVKSYGAADNACASFGGLIRIDTAAKELAIRQYLLDPANGLNTQSYWIQCRRGNDRQWRFDDGTQVPAAATNWMPGEPDPGYGATDCAYIWGSFNFLWDNYFCHIERGYICEIQ